MELVPPIADVSANFDGLDHPGKMRGIEEAKHADAARTADVNFTVGDGGNREFVAVTEAITRSRISGGVELGGQIVGVERMQLRRRAIAGRPNYRVQCAIR